MAAHQLVTGVQLSVTGAHMLLSPALQPSKQKWKHFCSNFLSKMLRVYYLTIVSLPFNLMSLSAENIISIAAVGATVCYLERFVNMPTYAKKKKHLGIFDPDT